MTAPAPDITRGILLAGGRGTRLFPLTVTTSKQLVPIFNKPTIFYPLSTMIAAGVHDILIITTPEHQASFQQLLGDGRSWGVRLSYATQAEPRGIAEALLIGAEYIAGAAATLLMLGDNLLFGPLQFLRDGIRATIDSGTAATIFGYHVSNPQAYGVVDFDDNFNALSIEEKPAQPKSSWAVPGMYIFPRDVVARARRLQPSKRGELEITDLNRAYLDDGLLRVNPIGRGVAWLDTGTPETLLDASNFVHAVETRQGLLVGCPEEAAYRTGCLSLAGLQARIADLPAGHYRDYLERLAADPHLHIDIGQPR